MKLIGKALDDLWCLAIAGLLFVLSLTEGGDHEKSGQGSGQGVMPMVPNERVFFGSICQSSGIPPPD